MPYRATPNDGKAKREREAAKDNKKKSGEGSKRPWWGQPDLGIRVLCEISIARVLHDRNNTLVDHTLDQPLLRQRRQRSILGTVLLMVFSAHKHNIVTRHQPRLSCELHHCRSCCLQLVRPVPLHFPKIAIGSTRRKKKEKKKGGEGADVLEDKKTARSSAHFTARTQQRARNIVLPARRLHKVQFANHRKCRGH